MSALPAAQIFSELLMPAAWSCQGQATIFSMVSTGKHFLWLRLGRYSGVYEGE